MARPTGSVAEVHKTRRDYRFGQETMQQIADGMRVFGGSLKETAFVERAIGHYAEFLAGDPEVLAQLTREMEWLQDHIRQLRHDQQTSYGVAQYAAEKATDQAQEVERLRTQASEMERTVSAAQEQAANQDQEKRRLQAQVQRLERELRTTKTALRLAEEKLASGPTPEKRARRKRPPSNAPQITIDSLERKATMGGYWLQWEQDGLCMNVGLEAVDEHSSIDGYRLEWYGSNPARKNLALGQRQQEHVFSFLAPARARLVEELLKAGWWPKDQAKPEDPTTIWMPPRKGEIQGNPQ
jgi:signal transduction histidine kinase